ncbi:hypothetical protein JCM19241_3296 [Vibrio ishigakensis]|uniref:Uncharacterized protein n=1 Tax=Vibrio ishigakensis TaxID=1481914 RepID=A0A0B8QLQ4_9VIBR|nr:hypothetical protein JCM19241_3296 [Vibrio ishigakensis]
MNKAKLIMFVCLLIFSPLLLARIVSHVSEFHILEHEVDNRSLSNVYDLLFYPSK